jgi:hypothetical protein
VLSDRLGGGLQIKNRAGMLKRACNCFACRIGRLADKEFQKEKNRRKMPWGKTHYRLALEKVRLTILKKYTPFDVLKRKLIAEVKKQISIGQEAQQNQ